MQWEYLTIWRDQFGEWHRSDVADRGHGDTTLPEMVYYAGAEGWEFFLIDSGTYWLKRSRPSK